MVDFIVLLIGRIVFLLQGMVLPNNVTIDDKDGDAIINVMIVLGKKGTIRSRTSSRSRNKCLSFPKQWESLDPLATKGYVH